MIKIKGDIGKKIKQEIIPITVFGIIMSFIIFGLNFINILLFYIVIVNLIILFLSLVSDYYDYFYYQSNEKYFVKNEQYIYMKDVDQVVLRKNGHIFDVNIVTRDGVYDLVKGLNETQKAYFESIIKDEHIKEIINEKGIGKKKRKVLLTLFFLIIVSLYGASINYLHKLNPNITKTSKNLEVTNIPYEENEYKRFYWLNYYIDRNYENMYTDNKVVSYKKDDTIIKIELGREMFATNTSIASRWILRIIGIENNFKIAEKIENARFGLFYLLMSVLIDGNVIESQKWETDNKKAFIKYKKIGGKIISEIQIFNKNTKGELLITILAPELLELKEKTLDFLEGIRIKS